ncbi:MAG: pitrilysin family protein [Candidatus Omnitrophota bacterium]|nr:pitrilysin family protein [Candidatus Omnitrophota bacterium]
MYKKFTLDNGLRVVTHRMSGMRSIALGIWIKVGGRYESQQNKGISHFIEHLLFKGTKKYSCRQIKEAVEGVGGALNGFTSEELTCYLIKAPARYLDLALDILSDMVIAPLFAPDQIQKERGVILEEIKMYKDLPQSHVHELLDELLWPSQPLGLSIAGSPESVASIDRDGLLSFKQNHYTAPNIIVSAAGLLDADKLIPRIEKKFSGLAKRETNRFSAARDCPDKPQLKIMDKPTEQTHLALGFHSLNRGHTLKHAVALLHIILGANMSSRLFNEVREIRGLAYEIGTNARYFADTGAFIVHAGIDNHKVEQAVEVILSELGSIKDKLVTEGEFKRAKEFYLGQLMLALEDTMDNMFWIGESIAALDKTYSLEDIVKEVRRLDRQDVRDVAARIFQENNLRMALIGPLATQRDALYQRLRIK